jgi:hypothetical protein
MGETEYIVEPLLLHDVAIDCRGSHFHSDEKCLVKLKRVLTPCPTRVPVTWLTKLWHLSKLSATVQYLALHL